MKDNLKQIVLGTGLGVLHFGMTKPQVEELLGSPSEKEEFALSEEDTEDITETWHYDELELSMSFDKADNWRLGTISVNADYYTLEGKIKVGTTLKAAQAVLADLDINDVQLEDWSNAENPDHKLLTSEEESLNLWFEDGVLSEIQWNSVYDAEGNIIWP